METTLISIHIPHVLEDYPILNEARDQTEAKVIERTPPNRVTTPLRVPLPGGRNGVMFGETYV